MVFSIKAQVAEDTVSENFKVYRYNTLLLTRNIDTLSQLIKTFNNEELFDWIQQNFWMRFAVSFRTINYNKELELLDSLYKNSPKKLLPFIEPLFLWAKADVNGADNKDSSVKIDNALKLIRLNDDFWEKGYAGRYGLLLSCSLYVIGHRAESQHILDSTIFRLSKLNKAHEDLLIRSLLSHGYYIKYKYFDKNYADSLNDIKLAAKYSMDTAEQNSAITHTLNDNVYLLNYGIEGLYGTDAKHAYIGAYAEFLKKLGNKILALREYTNSFIENADNFSDLENFYNANFNKTTFKEYLYDSVFVKLKTPAPFSLKNILGKTISLHDYKNNWVLIDFWGTWCGPCIAEMPKVNQLYDDIKNHKRDIRLISISCLDKIENVMHFQSSHNYDFPVAMSNGTVEKDYHVESFPTKYLITPTGKIILLRFGYDWLKTVNELTKY
ncbi:hypothetical protein A9P82_03120 [Arachidicoccus ginsenosidimutans]|nr:hypothetical protein A9P82_03120 [Arachidicoccus sp. BS20]